MRVFANETAHRVRRWLQSITTPRTPRTFVFPFDLDNEGDLVHAAKIAELALRGFEVRHDHKQGTIVARRR